MNRSSLPVGLSTLKKWKDEKDTLHFDIAYQRHQGMWGLPQKSMLVWSILADSYIPPIVLTKSEEDKVDEKGKSISSSLMVVCYMCIAQGELQENAVALHQ